MKDIYQAHLDFLNSLCELLERYKMELMVFDSDTNSLKSIDNFCINADVVQINSSKGSRSLFTSNQLSK